MSWKFIGFIFHSVITVALAVLLFMVHGWYVDAEKDSATQADRAIYNDQIAASERSKARICEKSKFDLVNNQNAAIQSLAEASKAQSDAAGKVAAALDLKSALAHNRTENLGSIQRAETCEARLGNIEKYLDSYIEKAADDK